MQRAIDHIKKSLMRSSSWLIISGLLIGFVLVPLVAAHAELSKANPAIGDIYRWTRPSEVRLTFAQELEPEGNSIIVTNTHFDEMQSAAAQIDPNDAYSLVVPLTALPAGTYTVNWTTASVDGHPLQGAYEFTIFGREAIFTMLTAGSVFLCMGAFAYSRRARKEEGESGTLR